MDNDGERGDVTNDERDLEVLLSYLVNKQLKTAEVILALGISRSAYYEQKERGTLCSPNNLIGAAQYFGLNPLDLLVHYGHIEPSDIEQYWNQHQKNGDTVDPPVVTTRGEVSVLKRRSGSAKSHHHLGSAI